uniref:Uncharacterized protein n=1 Tax=Romanomermis culicivorax TaxID=13658 RepID=A0A915JBN0_ROMCU
MCRVRYSRDGNSCSHRILCKNVYTHINRKQTSSGVGGVTEGKFRRLGDGVLFIKSNGDSFLGDVDTKINILENGHLPLETIEIGLSALCLTACCFKYHTELKT